MTGNELTEKELAFLKAFVCETLNLKKGPAVTLFMGHGAPHSLIHRAAKLSRGKIDLIDLLETEYSEDKEVEWPWANQNNYEWQ